MFFRYLRRELSGRRKQTAIIAVAMALAIALVIIVNSLSSGVKGAQEQALSSVYGVGTDLTVTSEPAAPTEGGGGRQNFDFSEDDGTTDSDGTQSLSQTRLSTSRGAGTFDASALKTISGTEGVEAASAVLSLNNIEFSGEIPQRPDTSSGSTDSSGTAQGQQPPSGEGAAGGQAGGPGGNFDVNQMTVMGVDENASTVGPLSSVEVTDGRTLAASDAGKYNAVVDSSYATSEDIAVGDKVNLGGKDFTVVGLVKATGSEGETASNVFIPLVLAQTLSDSEDTISTVYVKAASSNDISALKTSLTEALPDQEINSQEDLASTVSGSLSTASNLVSSLGTWLSVAVLGVAFLLAILLTISGVSRRTREFGTLKAVGWRNGSIVKQVAGESLVQAIIGGVIGIAVGLLGIWIINMVGPTLTASASTGSGFGGGFGGGQGGPGGSGSGTGGEGGMPGAASTATSASDIVLNAPFTPMVMAIAAGIAIVGGLLAGLLGGWRAARLRPAEALRSVA
ncbi:MAG: ABC transporter permease [Arthrobacter sp.]|jgi:ABC-type antimicrobial peptide transport system permease subunit|nr:ABC transporter permease [Arthrobacter sp.]